MQPQLLQVETPLEHASCWFINSGIQEPDGGVARYYQTDLESNAPVSTEITGYTVSALVYAFQRSGTQKYLEAAASAARFLMDEAWHAQTCMFPFELHTDGQPLRAYFFDCGIIVRGLLALWRETRDSQYLEAAERGGIAMRDFRTAESIHPVLELPEKFAAPHQPAWSRSPGCYQLKSAMAWKDLHAATGDASFRRDYERAVSTCMASEGTFLPAPDGPEKTMDRLHAYCYFLEGLLPVAGIPGVNSALAEGIRKVALYLREIEPVFVRSDVYAQLLRVRLYADRLAAVPLDETEALEEATRMTAFQSFDGDERRRGGFYFGRRRDVLAPYVNPVSTAFCMQALDMWNDFRDGKFEARPELLI